MKKARKQKQGLEEKKNDFLTKIQDAEKAKSKAEEEEARHMNEKIQEKEAKENEDN